MAFIYESARILAGNEVPLTKALIILEDATNPTTTKYMETLYTQVLDKKHVDFEDIPKSKGDIHKYSGYANLKEVLDTLQALSTGVRSSSDAIRCLNIVRTALTNIESLSTVYTNGFNDKNDRVILDYNCFVYCLVQATTSLLTEFVDFVKNPGSEVIDFKVRSTKYRAPSFYIDQLDKFNRLNTTNEYRGYLEYIVNKEKRNFTGAAVLGFSAVMAVALSIVPITRNIVYRIYRLRMKLADALVMQAFFLEMNKCRVQAKQGASKEKIEKILQKQEKIRQAFLKIADKLKVEDSKAGKAAANDIQKDNRHMTLGNVNRKTEDDSPSGDILL